MTGLPSHKNYQKGERGGGGGEEDNWNKKRSLAWDEIIRCFHMYVCEGPGMECGAPGQNVWGPLLDFSQPLPQFTLFPVNRACERKWSDLNSSGRLAASLLACPEPSHPEQLVIPGQSLSQQVAISRNFPPGIRYYPRNQRWVKHNAPSCWVK